MVHVSGCRIQRSTKQNKFGSTRIKNRAESAPQLLVCTAVEVGTRIPWDWEAAGGNASEPELIARIAQRLPSHALLVKDAGNVGYEWLAELLGSGRHILMRVAANYRLWAEQIGATLDSGGRVWLWCRNKPGTRPLELRLIAFTVRGNGGRKKKMYLVTDILDAEILSDPAAKSLYKMRWGSSEIGFRDLKQTLEKAALHSRTPAHALLECEFALLGMQVLSLLYYTSPHTDGVRFSLAQGCRVWRRAIRDGLGYSRIQKLFRACGLDQYVRKNPKTRRRAPQKKRPDTLSPPRLLKLTNRIKAEWHKTLSTRAARGF